MRSKLQGRMEKLEKTVQPRTVTILQPTDQEYEEYKSGRRPLPNGPYNFDFSLLSVEMLWQIVEGTDINYKLQENTVLVPITPMEKTLARMSEEELKAFQAKMSKIWDIEE